MQHHRLNPTPRTLATLLLALVALLSGCRAATVPQRLTVTLGGNAPETQMEFWHALAQAPVTSNDDAFHALLLYLDGEDAAQDYDARVATLKSRHLLPEKFDRPADEAVTRGNLAVAFVGIIKIKGGVVMRAVGAGPRYATRELQYEGLYPPSSPNQTFSGAEFVGVIGRIEDYQRSQPPAEQPAKVLPAEAEKPATPVPR